MKDYLPWVGLVTPVGSVELPLTPWKSGNLQATQVIFGKKEKVTCEPGTWRTVEEKLEEPSESFALVTVPEHSVCSTKT